MIRTHRTETSPAEYLEEVRKTLIEWRKGHIEATDAIAHLGWEYVDKIGELE